MVVVVKVGVGVCVQEEFCNFLDFQIIFLVVIVYQIWVVLLVKLFVNFFCFNVEVCLGMFLLEYMFFLV